MTDFGAMVVSGAHYGQFSRSFSAVCRTLPREMALRLCEINKEYFLAYGFEGVLRRMNDRTVSQIFAENQPGDVKEIASGEVDGVRYRLAEPAGKEPDEGNVQG